MKKNTELENELERRKKTFRMFRIIMGVIDIIALIILVIQIKLKDVAYYSYILLVICNIITFTLKPDMKIGKDNKKNKVQ